MDEDWGVGEKSLVLRDSVLGTGPEAYKGSRVAVRELQVASGSHQAGVQENLKLNHTHGC